jgi:hypothetical protein
MASRLATGSGIETLSRERLAFDGISAAIGALRPYRRSRRRRHPGESLPSGRYVLRAAETIACWEMLFFRDAQGTDLPPKEEGRISPVRFSDPGFPPPPVKAPQQALEFEFLGVSRGSPSGANAPRPRPTSSGIKRVRLHGWILMRGYRNAWPTDWNESNSSIAFGALRCGSTLKVICSLYSADTSLGELCRAHMVD